MAKLDHVLALLRDHQDELRNRGVLHAGVFGSVARGEDGLRSDVDLALDLDPSRSIGLFEFAGIGVFLEELIGSKVDMVERPCRKDWLRQEMERDYIGAF